MSEIKHTECKQDNGKTSKMPKFINDKLKKVTDFSKNSIDEKLKSISAMDVVNNGTAAITDKLKAVKCDTIGAVKQEFLPLVIGAAGVLVLIGGGLGYLIGRKK